MSSEGRHVGGSCVVGHEHSLLGGVGGMMVADVEQYVGGVVGDIPTTVSCTVIFPVSV